MNICSSHLEIDPIFDVTSEIRRCRNIVYTRICEHVFTSLLYIYDFIHYLVTYVLHTYKNKIALLARLRLTLMVNVVRS